MAIETILPNGVKQIERTVRVEFECPQGQPYQLRIHRELITYVNDEEVGRKQLPCAVSVYVSDIINKESLEVLLNVVDQTQIPYLLSVCFDDLVAEYKNAPESSSSPE